MTPELVKISKKMIECNHNLRINEQETIVRCVHCDKVWRIKFPLPKPHYTFKKKEEE